MTVGEKIKKFRTEQELSQKQLAIMVGISEPAIRNYELGNRQPSAKQLEHIAGALGISPFALSAPDLDSYIGFMHTLFTAEDMYGLQIGEIEGTLCLQLDKNDKAFHSLHSRFLEWKKEAAKLKFGEITKEEYDVWRYSYPRIEVERAEAEVDKLR